MFGHIRPTSAIRRKARHPGITRDSMQRFAPPELDTFMTKRLALLAALALSVALPQAVFAKDTVVRVDQGDKDMNAAIEKARTTLDDFLKVFKDQPAGTSDFRLKVKITDSNGSEHFWVMPFKQVGKGFEGVIDNEPDIVESVEAGETYKFSRADITDWGYVKNGKQVGSFTVCAMFKSMSKAQVKHYRTEYGFECKD